jgi:preprotein translocase subunit SecG
MYTVLLVTHLLITISLIAVVLLQKSETAGFGASSSGGMLSVRGQANLLTRLTAILATTFFVTSITLAIMARKSHENKSLFDVQAPIEQPVTPKV